MEYKFRFENNRSTGVLSREGRWIFGYEEEDDEIHFVGFFTDG
jgi:hypothetical protein